MLQGLENSVAIFLVNYWRTQIPYQYQIVLIKLILIMKMAVNLQIVHIVTFKKEKHAS